MLVDSTTMTLCLNKYRWATYQKTTAGVKLHLRVAFSEPKTVYPEKAILTEAKPSDRTQMDALIDETGATYVFDRGYMDYRKFDEFCQKGISFVTRLRKNAIFQETEEHPVTKGSVIDRDRIGILGYHEKKKMKHALRMIETRDLKGNVVQIITNRFDLSAEEIGDLYRNRWKIETFFRWIKQHLKLTRFYGDDKNAVWNQILICLIAYCLLLLLKLEMGTTKTLLELTRLLKANLTKPWSMLRDAIYRLPRRTSKGRQKVAGV